MKIPVEKSIYRKVYLQLRTGFLTERVGDNWVWRIYWNYRHNDLENKLYYLANKYRRINKGENNGI